MAEKFISQKKKFYIDMQDGEDVRSETEKLPKSSTYKFTMADFQENRKTIYRILGKSSNHFPWKRKKLPSPMDKE